LNAGAQRWRYACEGSRSGLPLTDRLQDVGGCL